MQDDKDFKDYIETLPPELKQAIYSIDYPEKLQEIVKNNKLMIDQAGKLEAETTLVMAGIEPMDKYVKNLIGNVGLSSIQASVVAHDVNESIFKNIREALKKVNDQINEEDKAVAETVEPNNPIPTKEDVLAGIEHPENIKNNEGSISISSLQSNSATPEIHETIDKGIEIKINNFPEIAPKAVLPAIPSPTIKQTEPLHLNIPSVSNVIESKPVTPIAVNENLEIRPNNLPEIAPKIPQPAITSLINKQAEPFHSNVSPVANIVESKLTNTVIVPKETIIVPDKTRLPEKPKPAVDPYKEPIV